MIRCYVADVLAKFCEKNNKLKYVEFAGGHCRTVYWEIDRLNGDALYIWLELFLKVGCLTNGYGLQGYHIANLNYAFEIYTGHMMTTNRSLFIESFEIINLYT